MRKLDIADGIPMVAELETAVKGMKGVRAGGLLVMYAVDLKEWLREATCKIESVITWWEILVILVQRTFGYRNPPSEFAWATMVLIPKGKRGYQDIGLVEVAWKVYAVVVDFWLKRGVVFHDALNGFRGVQGTGTATL